MAIKTIGAITDEDAAFVEEWESVCPATQFVLHEDPRGNEESLEVNNGDRFYITTKDRKINEHRMRNATMNPFTNGSFRPLVVPPDVTVTTNPNAVSDEHILGMFAGSDLAWEEWMRIIDSPATIKRMMDLADTSPDAKISHQRYRQLEDRLGELHPRANVRSTDDELNNFLYDERKGQGGVANLSMKPKNRPGGGFTRGG